MRIVADSNLFSSRMQDVYMLDGSSSSGWFCIEGTKHKAQKLLITFFCFTSLCVSQSPNATPSTSRVVTGNTLEQLSELNFDSMGMQQGLPHDSVYALT